MASEAKERTIGELVQEAFDKQLNELRARTSKAMHELAKVHDILDAECKALGVQWQGGNAGTLQAVLAKLRERDEPCSYCESSFPTYDDGCPQCGAQPRIVEHVFWNDEFNRANTPMFDFNYAPCDILEELPPAPSVEEPEGGRYVFYYYEDGYAIRDKSIVAGHHVARGMTLSAAKYIAAYLNGDSPEHRQLTELRAENERLMAKLVDFGVWRSAMRWVASAIKCAVSESDGPVTIGKKILIPPVTMAGTESDLDEAPDYRVTEITIYNKTGQHAAYAIVCNGKSRTEAESNMQWLNRRTEIERELANRVPRMYEDRDLEWLSLRPQIEAQLATYKQQAEAWEAVKRHKLSVCREFGEQNFFASFSGYSKCPHERYSTSYADPAEAVLALARQLESQQPSDGK